MAELLEDDEKKLFETRGAASYNVIKEIDPEKDVARIESIAPTIGGGLMMSENDVYEYVKTLEVEVTLKNPKNGPKRVKEQEDVPGIYVVLKKKDGNKVKVRIADVCPYLEMDITEFPAPEHQKEVQKLLDAKDKSLNGTGSRAEILSKLKKAGTFKVIVATPKVTKKLQNSFTLPSGDVRDEITQRYYLFGENK